jgi:hypothetical protein
MGRLPVPGSDEGAWGEILNTYLSVSLKSDGVIKDDAVTAAQVQDGSLTGAQLQNGTIPPVKLDAIDSPTNGEILAYNNARFEWVAQSGGSVPDASGSTKGVVQLTNDLGGTATAPTVPALANKADKVAITGATKTKITYNSQGIVTGGADATQDDIGDGVTFKQYSSTEKTKLTGIASGATANSSDATLLNRANHTGTQTAVTISDFSTAADARVAAAVLDNLSDVTITAPSNGQILKYNGSIWVNDTDATGSAGTNLSSSTTTTTVTVISDTGTDATLVAATGSAAGVLTAADKTKLDGIATGATANSTDAQLRDRSTHTGTQTASTISDFTTAADARITAATGTTIQPLDSDLTAIAALSPTNDDIIQRKAGAWTNRTPAQVKTDLALTKADVGLANVDDTSDANKSISTATQTALDTKPSSTTIDNIVTLTQAEYTALTPKVATTLYVIIP